MIGQGEDRKLFEIVLIQKTLVYCVRRYCVQRGWKSRQSRRRGWSACTRAGRSPTRPGRHADDDDDDDDDDANVDNVHDNDDDVEDDANVDNVHDDDDDVDDEKHLFPAIAVPLWV